MKPAERSRLRKVKESRITPLVEHLLAKSMGDVIEQVEQGLNDEGFFESEVGRYSISKSSSLSTVAATSIPCVEKGSVVRISPHYVDSVSPFTVYLALSDQFKTNHVLYVCRLANAVVVARQILAQKADIGPVHLLHGSLTDAGWDRLCVALGELTDRPFTIVSADRITFEQLRLWLTHTKNGPTAPGLIVLDDAELLDELSLDSTVPQEDAIAELKAVASEYEVAIAVVGAAYMVRDVTHLKLGELVSREGASR